MNQKVMPDEKNYQQSPPSPPINQRGRMHTLIQKMTEKVDWSRCPSHNAMKMNNIVTWDLTTVIKILYQYQTLAVADIFKQLHWIIPYASLGTNEGLRAIMSHCINYLDASSPVSTSAAQVIFIDYVAATLLSEVTFYYVPGSELSWGFTLVTDDYCLLVD